MNTYDVKCPICGHVNRSIYLEDTQGWMECENCRKTMKVRFTRKMTSNPMAQPETGVTVQMGAEQT